MSSEEKKVKLYFIFHPLEITLHALLCHDVYYSTTLYYYYYAIIITVYRYLLNSCGLRPCFIRNGPLRQFWAWHSQPYINPYTHHLLKPSELTVQYTLRPLGRASTLPPSFLPTYCPHKLPLDDGGAGIHSSTGSCVWDD